MYETVWIELATLLGAYRLRFCPGMGALSSHVLV